MKKRTEKAVLVSIILAITAIIGIIIAGGIIENEIIIAEEKNIIIQNSMDDEAGIVIQGGIIDDEISGPMPIVWIPGDDIAIPIPVGW
jgi:hypothetical protein